MVFMLTLWDLTLAGIPEDQMDWERERTWCLITPMTALQASGFHAEEGLMAGYLRWGKDGPFHLHSSSLLGHKSPLPWSSTQNTRNAWSLEMLTERKWCYLLSKYHWNSGTLHQERARRVSNNLGRVCVYLSSQTPSSVSHRGLNILLCWTSGLSFLSNCIFNQTCMTSVVQFLY